ALDAVDHALSLGRHRTGDEAGRVAPQVLVIDARVSAELRLHHVQPLIAGKLRHLVVLDADGAHGAGRARLLAARLFPALVDQVRVKGPGLRQRQLLVPPDVAVRTGLDQIAAAFRLHRIDHHDSVGALAHSVAAALETGRIVAVI